MESGSGRPAVRCPRDVRLPVLVPVGVRVGVVEADGVVEHAGGIDLELECALAVAARAEIDLDEVGLDRVIAAGEARDDRRLGLGAGDAEVDRVVVVEDLDGGALDRRLAAVRHLLGEAIVGGRGAPGGVVELAVDLHRQIGTCRSHALGRSAREEQADRNAPKATSAPWENPRADSMVGDVGELFFVVGRTTAADAGRVVEVGDRMGADARLAAVAFRP